MWLICLAGRTYQDSLSLDCVRCVMMQLVLRSLRMARHSAGERGEATLRLVRSESGLCGYRF